MNRLNLSCRNFLKTSAFAGAILLPMWMRPVAAASAIPSLDDLAGDWNAASDLRSFPVINSPRGEAKSTTNVLALEDISFPPIFLSGPTASLKIDGKDVQAQKVRWYPYQVLRHATVSDYLKIETAVALASGENAALLQVTLRNSSNKPHRFSLEIDLGSLPVSVNQQSWSLPHPKSDSGFLASVERGALTIRAPQRNLLEAYAFSTTPDSLLATGKNGQNPPGGQAIWKINLEPGKTREISLVLACGGATAHPEATSKRLASGMDRAAALAKADWEKHWKAMFQPGNAIFSGNAPTLITNDTAVRRVYYMSLVSLLEVYRDSFPRQPRIYISNSAEFDCTMMYFWDTREWATLFALLDPQMLRACLLNWLTLDIHQGYAEDYLSGRLQGPFYSANDFSVFLQIDTYLSVTGDRDFLQEKAGSKTVLQHLNDIALYWKSRVRPGRHLADYGGARNLLECVPTYINEVPSFNAANVWMMREAALIDDSQGLKDQARQLRSDAAALLPEVLALYEPGQGIWDSLHADGQRVPMRHVLDFATIGLTLDGDLTARTKSEMINFVKRELLTDTWMRAQSLQDVAASQSDRPDHGPMGAFSAWPAETTAVFCRFGDYPDALGLLHRVAAVTSEGPFSQSRELLGRKHDSPARIASRGQQTYNVSSGASFAEAIVCNLFGYNPNVTTRDPVTTFSDSIDRGFTGELVNIRFHGDLYKITLDVHGRRTEKQNL